MSIKQLFFSFEGRIGRLQWWIAMLAVELVSLVLATGGFWLAGEDPTYYWNDEAQSNQTIALVEILALILTLRPALAVDIKRIHDRTRTAYLLVPLYLFTLISIYRDDKGRDIFGLLDLFDQRNGESDLLTLLLVLGIVLIFILLVYILWLVIELGFLRGTSGLNKYGSDPLGKQKKEPV